MTLRLDTVTKQAVRHTVHCLIGCGIGEVTGMFIAAALGWPRLGRLSLAILLAFAFGYYLTYRGVRKHTETAREAMRITATTDTVSIATMEAVDNTMEFLIPNALMVTPLMPRFWWGLAVSLAIAFMLTVPVNRYMIARNPHQHHH